MSEMVKSAAPTTTKHGTFAAAASLLYGSGAEMQNRTTRTLVPKHNYRHHV